MYLRLLLVLVTLTIASSAFAQEQNARISNTELAEKVSLSIKCISRINDADLFDIQLVIGHCFVFSQDVRR